MKITGVLADLMVKITPDVYGGHIVMRNAQRLSTCKYYEHYMGCSKQALMWYKKSKKDLEGIVFHFNPYDPCVAN